MSRVVDEHRHYLSDSPRLSAFERAIQETIKPGQIVADLASGTGILGLYACRAGAARVYAIDQGGIIGLAREIARANGFLDRIVFVQSHSTRAQLPERVDVVLSDQLSHLGFEAGACQDFEDARKRFLKPGGVIVPGSAEMIVAPVEFGEMYERIEFWKSAPAGFAFEPARKIAANTGYPIKFTAGHLLGEPVSGFRLDFQQEQPVSCHIDVTLTASRGGLLHGIGGWFHARLSEHVTLTNSPLAPGAISRRNVFFPIDRPVAVSEGDRIRVRMGIAPRELMVKWDVEILHRHGGKERFRHSTWQGSLMTRQEVERTRPEFVPRLSPWGVARRSILELCDSKRTLHEIEQQVYGRHPDLFDEPGKAAAFVAEVITRYAE